MTRTRLRILVEAWCFSIVDMAGVLEAGYGQLDEPDDEIG